MAPLANEQVRTLWLPLPLLKEELSRAFHVSQVRDHQQQLSHPPQCRLRRLGMLRSC